MRNRGIFPIKDLSDLFQSWPLGLHIKEVDEKKLNEDPDLGWEKLLALRRPVRHFALG